jgi:Asp-tRNA(Asn)/Glu-tRNA(Gln) amidotransferase A subunit family amidase
VIPLEDGTPATSQSTAPEISPDLFSVQPEKLGGRFNSIADYHARYKAGELSPLQVVEILLPLIRRDVDKPSKYSNAWLQTNPEEVLAAARASAERWAAGRPLTMLDGVPFGVKDDVDVEGFVSTIGMKVDKSIPFFTTPAERTVWPVIKLQEAGAIMMGKMNMHEVGMGMMISCLSHTPIFCKRFIS